MSIYISNISIGMKCVCINCINIRTITMPVVCYYVYLFCIKLISFIFAFSLAAYRRRRASEATAMATAPAEVAA